MSLSSDRIDWKPASDVEKRVSGLVASAEIDWVDLARIKCFRSERAQTRAIARIWGLPRIWQIALNEGPHYVIEVISEKFDKLNAREQDRVLLHEIAHIPKNFSGALLPHRRKGKGNFYSKLRAMIKKYDRT